VVMPQIKDSKTLAAAGADAEEGVPGMGTGLEVEVLCGASW
jgi:hypothetical protein